jgi:guanylate kinase
VAGVDKELTKGHDVILEIDWQGAQQVRKMRPDALSIFIIPPSLDALRERLQKRGQDVPEVIRRRLLEASAEISHYHEYDYLVVNENFERALADLTAIFCSQRLKMGKQQIRQQKRLQALLS